MFTSLHSSIHYTEVFSHKTNYFIVHSDLLFTDTKYKISLKRTSLEMTTPYHLNIARAFHRWQNHYRTAQVQVDIALLRTYKRHCTGTVFYMNDVHSI